MYHPIVDYIDKLTPKNSTEELDRLCATLEYETPEDQEFGNVLIKRWLISTIAALYNPQFSSQGVLTLQGKGGIRKSTWLRNLRPVESAFIGEFIGFDVHDKDDVAKATKAWIVELAELESTMKKDYISLKGYITSIYDEYRAAYARRMHKHKRKTVYCASVNSIEFLKDDTGNRRFWVLGLKAIDTDTKIDLDKLYSEIKFLYHNNEPYYLNADEEEKLRIMNSNFSVTTSLDGILLNFMDLTPGYPTVDITASKLMPLISHFGKMQSSPSQIGTALIKLGFTGRRKRLNGKPQLIYSIPLLSSFEAFFGSVSGGVSVD
jgi:putative DNA primase/helicase